MAMNVKATVEITTKNRLFSKAEHMADLHRFFKILAVQFACRNKLQCFVDHLNAFESPGITELAVSLVTPAMF